MPYITLSVGFGKAFRNQMYYFFCGENINIHIETNKDDTKLHSRSVLPPDELGKSVSAFRALWISGAVDEGLGSALVNYFLKQLY